ncbi:MAG: hypothetical protein OXH53_09485 [bacterium]|nr:hypothetical protein [bacterium]
MANGESRAMDVVAAPDRRRGHTYERRSQMKLPISSYKVLRMIILGYLHQGGADRKPAALGDVEKSTGIKLTTVSGNNGALAEFGIIQKEGNSGYRLTDAGLEVARALEFEEPQLTRRALGELLQQNDTVGQFLNTLRVRGAWSAESATRHLLLSSGQTKSTGSALTGARAVLDMLEAAGLAELDGDEIRAALGPSRRPDDDEGAPISASLDPNGQEEDSTQSPESLADSALGGAPPVTVTVEISLNGDDLVDHERSAAIIDAIRSLSSRD